ncbi:hypothetical protein [Limimonas halophila]|uniref:hypothetical protein n=1 Tax=Limimonas halophila TaxID=1082479 RepID=UPI00115FE333|nr:hypothetical protein [Limimonas halophila]
MAEEYREITFDKRELQVALRDYGTRTGRIEPGDGGAVGVEITRRNEVEVKLSLETRRVTFNAEEITAALILFASSLQMPVPRRAQKTLSATRERVTLELRTHTPYV